MKTMSRIWLLVLLVPAAAEPRTLEAWGRRPLAFEENRGQTDPAVRFLARAPGYALFLTPSEAVVAPRGASALRLRWVGTGPGPALTGEGELPGRTHSLMGADPTRWRTGIASFERVRYRGVYPGIDLVFYGDPRQLEYDFAVFPGADPAAIRLAVEGAERIEIDAGGDLVLRTAGGEVRMRRPAAYQEVRGLRREVASRWRPLRDGTLGFAVGPYDRKRPLVIDPVLVYSTFLGGSGTDMAHGIAVDAAGNVYVTGMTTSGDLPGAGPQAPAGFDAFVTKLDGSGAPLFSTIFGGSGWDIANDLAVDTQGNVYVTGTTRSPDFPRVHPLQPQSQSGIWEDVFVAKLDASGSHLLYASNLGGSREDRGWDIAVDAQGHACVTGVTDSHDFPTSGGSFLRGFQDAFIARVSPGGGALVYSRFHGGSRQESAAGIAVDAAGSAWVVGYTTSGDFPTTADALQKSLANPPGFGDAFISRFDPSGGLIYSTYLGGSGGEGASSVALDAAGNIHVAGVTGSTDFPVLRPLQPSLSASMDGFVTRLSAAGALIYSTFLGGSDDDAVQGIAADAAGNAYVTGFTFSPDFPLREPVQPGCNPSDPALCNDLFLTRIGPQGALVYSTYLGGGEPDSWDNERSYDVAVDRRGDAYIVGWTSATDFPTVNAAQPQHAGGESFAPNDAIVARFSTNRPPACSSAHARPVLLWPPDGKLRPVSIDGVTDPDGDPVTLTVTSIRQDEPLSKKGSPDAAGVGTATPRVRADRLGGGDGRVYHLGFMASDGRGGTCSGAVTVCVPRDQRPGSACGDGGPLVDSEGGLP